MRSELLYLGQCVDAIGNVRQKFRNKRGKILLWSGLKFIYFGESYLTNADDTFNKNPERPKKQTIFATEKERLEYESQKVAIIDAKNRKKKDMLLRRPHPDITRAVELLRPFCRDLDLITLSRFIGYIKNEVTKQRGKK